MNGNEITLVGNLTRDVELRFTQAGRAIAAVGVASSRRYQAQSGDWQEETSFFNLSIWGDLGENCAASLSKGDRVVVTGRMLQRTYQNKDGVDVTAWDVVVDEIGPSLRWATAQVQKVNRSTTERPAPAPAPAAAPAPGPAEEPF